MQATDPLARDGWQRCFIALAPAAATRAALAAIPVPAHARPVPGEQLHLTVAFIGALGYEPGRALAQALAAQARPVADAPVARVAYWPGAARPRLMVATFAMTDAFVELDWRVRSLMIGLGLSVDARAFRPHITLARFGRLAHDVARETPAFTPFVAHFDALMLYSSTLAARGAQYRALAHVPLR